MGWTHWILRAGGPALLGVAIALIALFALGLTATLHPAERSAVAADPVAVVQEFLRAMHAEDCEAVWQHFSTRSRRTIERESARRIAEGDGIGADGEPYTDAFTPKHLYCRPTVANRYLSYVPESAGLVQIAGERATVRVQEAEGTDFLIPGFFPTKTIYHEREMTLVREGSTWRIDLP